MSGHTPGPWVVEIIGSPRVMATDAKGNFPVCDLRGWGHLTGKGHGALSLPHDEAVAIQKANTHLIAAAPDLLAALNFALTDPCFSLLGSVTKDEIFAAIAKAEGRAP